MTTNDSKSYLNYLIKLLDEYNNTYHHSIGKTAIDADYSALPEEIETNLKAPGFKVGNKVMITKYKNVFCKGYTKNWSKKIFVIDSVLKTNRLKY